MHIRKVIDPIRTTVRCEYRNFHKNLWTLPDDGLVELKYVATKSSNE
jgi:hypothetical protein